MDYNEFKAAVLNLGHNLDEITMMDAYAQYEISNCTIEASVETIIQEEIEYNLYR